jgi:threonine dehydrogenase-like Zn-dependent dehydrogenase
MEVIMLRSVEFRNGEVFWTERPIPNPQKGEALIKVLYAGICNTDLELLHGYYNFNGVAGHEFVGKVIRAPGQEDWEGATVVAEINIGCDSCDFCRKKEPRHCKNRKAIGINAWDGAFAEYLKVPTNLLHKVEDSIPLQEAVFAEPLAAALEISQQVHIRGSDRLVVLGDGKMGLLISLGLKAYSPNLLLVGKYQNKLAIAAEQGVRTFQLKAPYFEIAQILDGYGHKFDLVIEATGNPEGMNDALELVRPEGIIVAKTTSHLDFKFNLAKLVVDEITLIGSRCGDISLALELLKEKRLSVVPLIEACYPFDKFEEALARACQKGAKKVLLQYF